ncbi:alpha/beta hydrolase family protein [Leptothoe sp. PORK10 BA2]|uniref:alpha/beta hydrolase family protein n=1 Tax=Leptothoe sp. PORK10 BA2 TaxID=3110254 RepID=UPI002B1EDA50|nr:prolyl oligopeptidase family serine peptidase [Leptothoe sp. PORK10 BA2]MEA5462538.1 prolyl oligopeptidase family serine peptidase [Leptothoe sp. PORK10 BA2]
MPVSAQIDQPVSTWQNPPEPIVSMLDADQLPAVSISPDNQWLVEFERRALPPISELAEPWVAIAGTKLNPATWGPAQEASYKGITVRPLGATESTPIALPAGARIRNLYWSYDSRYLAFTLTQADGIEPWVLDLAEAKATPLAGPILNGVYNSPCHWLPGDDGMICKVRPQGLGAPPTEPTVPPGPIIESSQGRVAATRTYTNLLKSPHDEALFEYYFSAQLAHISLAGDITLLDAPSLIRDVTVSPDGQWLLRSTVHRPFSYQVPLGRFPVRYELLNRRGEVIHELADLPLADDISLAFDSVRPGKRNISWRTDQPATLYWVEALDGGDANTPADHRDGLYTLAAPFDGNPTKLWRSTLRFQGVTWSNDTLAIATEAWYDSRQLKTWAINPQAPGPEAKLLDARDFQDAYANPGTPVTMPGPYGRSVLQLSGDGTSLYLSGGGASPEGVFPFLDRLNLATLEKERLWQAEGEIFSQLIRILDGNAQSLIVCRESQTSPSNYHHINLSTGEDTPLTELVDPLAWYADVQKEIVRYPRADDVTLTATLYLPPGYDATTDGPLPTIFWAYPEEFKDRQVASQNTRSEYTFTRPGRDSVLFLLTQGYAVLSGPTMPIIGEGDTQPNDTYIEQLVSSAEAAIDYLVERGVSDGSRLAIGGHSYGAFTAANLLAHSDLFQAGIARSGAYNRTLTPFGFQGEQRTFWETPETYLTMSPFISAEKINEPLLLIHGAEDTNAGTYPLQSERLYEAVKGLGGTVRYVSLPAEGHGYRSREAVGHVLWEMVEWLDQHVKGEP